MADAELVKMAEARVGMVLRGKYRLDRVLGIGGMATVYAATHRNKKKVAIKMLHPELSMRENVRTRFLREGYVANSVDHPGAVSVLDDDVAEDGSAFLVMEMLVGSAVDEVAAAEGPRLPLALVLSIADQLLEVLANAHEKGIVHRDLKPANLFLTNDGRLEVLDFGIARLHDETTGESTAAGAMLGTPAFMAPEQAMAESTRIDAQTDLWAVGATMFSLLSGELVHEGGNAAQLLVHAATKTARGVASVVPDVPAPIAEVIDKALSFDKGARWKSAVEMREALAKACVEATGAPIAPLPKREPADKGLASHPSSDVGFESTVAAPSAGSTTSPIAKTPPAPTAPAKRPLRWRRWAEAAVGCAVLAGGALAYRAAVAPHAHYCLVLDERRDGPHCAFEVTSDVVAKRRLPVTRITTRRGRAELVEHVSFAGAVDDREVEFARMEIKRDDKNAVTDIVKYDRFGVMTQWQKWSESGARIDYVDIDGKTPRPFEGHISTVRVTYDDEGRVTSRRYYGSTGRPRADEDGIYGEAYEWGNTPGAWTKRTFLDSDGKPTSNLNGIGVYRRPDNGQPFGDYTMFDARDRPTTRKGVHTDRRMHDDVEETGQAFFGLHDEPITNLEQAFHELRVGWDATKHTADYIIYDEHGRPQPVRDIWIWGLRRTYDDRGRRTLEEMLDAQGNLAINMNGWSAMRSTYDDGGKVIADEFLGPSRTAIRTIQGFARREFKHDAHDNTVEVRFFDDAGHLAPWTEGGAIQRETFDDRDLVLSRASFDGDDRPVVTMHGFASQRSKYDHMRNLVEVATFDTEGKPAMSDDGYAIKRYAYDDNDDLVEESYFDATGAPTPYQSSYATRRLKNDLRGQPIETTYLDVHGDPTLVKAGFASVKAVRNHDGDVVEEAFFGKHGEPVMREGGFSIRKTKYDVGRRPIEIALFDTAGKPVRGAAGWAVERTTYDERGLDVRIDHLDASGAPALDRDGRASIVRTNDGRGNLVEETSLDVAGKPVATLEGWATKKSRYDDRDMVIEESFFDAAGAPARGRAGWSVRRVRYDDFGKVTEEAFFDVGHEPVVPKGQGYASMRQRYDARHLLVEVAYFDVRGVAAPGPEGAAVVRTTRDGYGRASETAYLDGTGAPVASKDGHFVVRTTYDAVGHPIDERFLDAQGGARAGSDGCAGRHTKYDALGRELEQSCLDASGKDTFSTAGFSQRRTLHDARGNDVEVATYAPDGTLHADKRGVARTRNRFDERNQLVETTFFDVGDKPTHDEHGAFTIRYRYDDAGKRIGAELLDQAGHALPPPGPG